MGASEPGLEPLRAIEQGVRRIVDRVGPAVVGLGRGWGLGSGIVIGPDRVLASAHGVRGTGTPVAFADGRRAPAEVTGTDPDRDVALLSVETGPVPPIAWEPEAQEVAIGCAVIALADPGGRGLRATPGFVSAVGRRFRGLRGRRLQIGIEHTAPLPRGSSGGPLVDLQGRLLGLNTLRLEGGLVLAVAADGELQRTVRRIGSGQAPPVRRLGVALAPPPVARRMRSAVGLPGRDGLLVRAVEEGTPAARCGIAAGDLIVAAGGAPVDGLEALHAALEAVPEGGALAVRVLRGAEELELVASFEPAAEGA